MSSVYYQLLYHFSKFLFSKYIPLHSKYMWGSLKQLDSINVYMYVCCDAIDPV